MKIILNEVSKKYSGFFLREISLEFIPGSYTVILGPSGAGKTIILEIIAGLLQPDSGTVTCNYYHKIGLIYQDYMLFPHLNVKENISYGLRVRKTAPQIIEQKVSEISEKLKISQLLDRKIEGLSGGEKQRIAIARAMAVDPELYLIDEPTASLDHSLKYKTQKIFLDLHKKTGATFIHVTHDFREALTLADKIVVVMDGRVVQQGVPDEVFQNPESKEIADFLGYKNVFKGTINGNLIDLGKGVQVQVPEIQSELAYIAIRSDDIFISDRRIDSSARNTFCGLVTKIINQGVISEIQVDVGILLNIEITSKSRIDLKLEEGQEVWVSFKVTSVKVFKH